MAGAVGAGGLGDLAIGYGYQRFETSVMIAVIVVLIALVALIQAGGDRLARLVDHGDGRRLGILIPRLVDQDPWAQLRRPMEMIRQG
jgi:hypothetical protein